ncbi:MAG: metalloregulator ArsR/SmtB family transcription factor [Phycisphaeraceae bacterium]|nr:metalloregulator ArsR/SmtB family transcription factor [Phycisphaerales bacterium]MCB9860437.1 metalloregulator ArsR/SmtB family transcription factor [Phycisphaeraceae bacterium]
MSDFTWITSLDDLTEAAECFRTLAHPVRLRMIEVLLDHRLTVGEIAELCEIQPHAASEHLGMMRDRGLLDAEREGRKMFYTIAEPGLRSIMDCVHRRYRGEPSCDRPPVNQKENAR